ncbi:NADH:ubiquinone reductase (Na(+)-transporting) subunit C [Geofilum sp. OHC36d9]|uniref:NADH:ubiquinone reductase (Na(+)-transporting) subunit C n=1 Tax=Geofilum sp. OHC36d9 TaxID=3458413 RepID=UPI0040331BFC
MNKQGNAYTFIYASVLVVVVAALLAFVSQGLKDRQLHNEEVAKMVDILRSINVEASSADAVDKYQKIVGESSYIVNFKGEKVDGVAFDVDLAEEVRKPIEDRNYPVYEAHLENGGVKYILQLRGTGLWGPIWGYISVNDDGNTVYGATFGHKGETPGLGAEIAKPAFQAEFPGKQIFEDGKLVSIAVVKGGAAKDAKHEVDAISGGTITSKGLQSMLGDFFKGYESFLKNIERESHE